MKLEYLATGSQVCPLIRLYRFIPSEAAQLRDVFASLANDRGLIVHLHELPFVEQIAGCTLHLRVGQQGTGILQTGPSEFDCHLSTDAWREAAERVTTLTEPCVEDCYQWLNQDGDVSLLLSTTGRW